MIISNKNLNQDLEQTSQIFSFDHENVISHLIFNFHYFALSYLQEYTFPINDEFLSKCCQSAISIEVWYQNKTKLSSDKTIKTNAKTQEISKRWKDVKRHLQFSLEIHELNAEGQWTQVDVDTQQNILTGGIYRLKQVLKK